MTQATKAPAPAPAKPANMQPVAQAPSSGIDFSKLQVQPGGVIRHQTTDKLVGTPIPTQLAESWAARDAKGFGSTFTVGPVSEDVLEMLKNLYRRGAANAGHGVAFSYNATNRGLTVRAQGKKSFDMSTEAVARRKAARETPEAVARRAKAKAAREAKKA